MRSLESSVLHADPDALDINQNAAWNPTTALIQTNTADLLNATPYSVDFCRNISTSDAAAAACLYNERGLMPRC